MGTNLIRRAAASMRQKAELATSGRWQDVAIRELDGSTYNAVGIDRDPEAEVCALPRTPQGSMDADYISAMDPAVTLVMAAWLDDVADAASPGGRGIAAADEEAATRIAHVYLRGDES